MLFFSQLERCAGTILMLLLFTYFPWLRRANNNKKRNPLSVKVLKSWVATQDAREDFLIIPSGIWPQFQHLMPFAVSYKNQHSHTWHKIPIASFTCKIDFLGFLWQKWSCLKWSHLYSRMKLDIPDEALTRAPADPFYGLHGTIGAESSSVKS